MADNYPVVWVFLVERTLEAGSDLRLFWHEAEAIETARGHVSGSWPIEDLVTPDQVSHGESSDALTRGPDASVERRGPL